MGSLSRFRNRHNKRGEGGLSTVTVLILIVVFFLLFLAIVGVILLKTGLV